MASRKRPFSEDEDAATTKKRALTGPNGSPRVNVPADEVEPGEGDNLELFRKEAIFRRMKHYSREHQRSQSRIAELERRKHTCEAGLATMAACWNQLVKTIRLLLNTEDLPEVADEMFDFTAHIRGSNKLDYVKTLEDNMSATQSLVDRLAKAGGNAQAHLTNGRALAERQKATTECISLQSQMDLMRVELQDTVQQKKEYHDLLAQAENRLLRLQSPTVLATQTQGAEKRPEYAEASTEEPQRKPSSPAGSKSPAQPNGLYDPTEMDTLRDQVAVRETKIIELEREVAVIRDEKALLEADLQLLSYDKISENPHYKTLLDHASTLQTSLTDSRAQTARLSEELNLLRGSRKDWEDGVNATANQSNQELKTMLNKRDSENSRLREQRDQQIAELNERKQQDSIKMTSLREVQKLAESRSERISALESEVGRCKSQLAAHAGHEELMTFFMNGNIEQAQFFESLQQRAASAEKRATLLEELLSKYQADRPEVANHLKAEMDALQALAQAQAELKKYKSIYGDTSSLPPDVSTLSEQLQQKEEELQRLRLLDIQHSQAETTLYAEIDKLSVAWESLDKQVKDKVFDLSGLEAQVKRAASDKAKSENKFYAAMRDKDAIEAERLKLSRDVEKQNKVVERLVDTEKNLAAQLFPKGTLEKELATLKHINHQYKGRADTLAEEFNHTKSQVGAARQLTEQMRAAFSDLAKTYSNKTAELRKLEDGLIRAKKELELKKQREASAPQVDSDEGSGLMFVIA
ncbi:hypothetical protein DXG03_003196 [Asterophora parasitica]|uniref:E3 ubiquitin protein ligase n=1 Tax=Asterophora parasitica TaxID=117018 RepID=A0A9P7KH92_9AGAR|nr:hypothetical protein DXG03_003196 [Asterophora parasitica]